MSNFLITHYHRAGSTLLQHLLGSHDDVVCYFRPFGNDWYGYDGSQPNKDPTISSTENFFDWIYIKKDDKRLQKIKNLKFYNVAIDDIRDNFNNPIQMLDWIYENNSDKIKSIGVKYSFGEFEKYKNLLSYVKENKTKVIIVKRRNLLEQVYSHIKASHQNEWVIFENENEIIEQMVINIGYDDCLKRFQEIEKYNNIYTRRIPNFLEIFYEDLIDNRDEKLKEVFNYIGVEYDSNNFIPHIPNKMNTSRMENVIENYYDLKNKFKDTKYYEFFN